MSLEIKVSFLKELETSLASRVTAADMSSVITCVSDVLEHYDFNRVIRTEENFGIDLIEAFISALRVQGRSEKTLWLYEFTLNRLMNDLNVSIRSVTVYHLRSWLAKEKERGISDQTLKGNRWVFSSFFGWLWREGLITKNPVDNLGTIKTQKKVKEVYADVDIEKLKSACTTKRNLAIVAFLLSTGCRISEVTQLNRNDIDFHNMEVVVLGKGNKERTVYIDSVTSMYLQNYFNERKDDDPCLFYSKNKRRLEPNSIRAMLNVLAKNAGVKHVHPHKFRRTLATMLIAHGMPIQEVAAILGHEKLDTTMEYVVMDKTTIKNSYRKSA